MSFTSNTDKLYWLLGAASKSQAAIFMLRKLTAWCHVGHIPAASPAAKYYSAPCCYTSCLEDFKHAGLACFSLYLWLENNPLHAASCVGVYLRIDANTSTGGEEYTHVRTVFCYPLNAGGEPYQLKF